MSQLGRVPPSAGRDVVDSKACFLSLLAQAAVWLLELRVARTFLDQLRPRFSGHGYPTQRAANTFSPRSDVLRRWSQATGPCEGPTARRWLCLRTGSGITEARPHPRALPPPRTTWAKWTIRVYFVPQSKWPLPRSLRASEPVDPRERGGNDGAVSEQSQLCGCLSLSE